MRHNCLIDKWLFCQICFHSPTRWSTSTTFWPLLDVKCSSFIVAKCGSMAHEGYSNLKNIRILVKYALWTW